MAFVLSIEVPPHSRMGPNLQFGRPCHRWTTVGGRVNEPVLSPPSSCRQPEAEDCLFLTNKTAPDW